MDNSGLMWLAFAILFLEAYLGLALVLLRKIGQASVFDRWALPLLNCFAGGVFVSFGLQHLLPDAAEAQDEAYPGKDYPLAYLFAVIGFMAIFLVQQVLPKAVAQWAAGPGGDGADAVADLGAGASASCCVPGEVCGLAVERAAAAAGKVADVAEKGGVVGAGGAAAAAAAAPGAWGQQFAAYFSPVLLMSAMIIHAFIEGLTLGMQPDYSATVTIFLALASHKWVESVVLATRFMEASVSPLRIALGMFPFAILCPIGIAVGISMSDVSPWSRLVLYGLVAGAFVYFGACDIIVTEFAGVRHQQRRPWWWRLALFGAVVVGNALVGLLSMVEGS